MSAMGFNSGSRIRKFREQMRGMGMAIAPENLILKGGFEDGIALSWASGGMLYPGYSLKPDPPPPPVVKPAAAPAGSASSPAAAAEYEEDAYIVTTTALKNNMPWIIGGITVLGLAVIAASSSRS